VFGMTFFLHGITRFIYEIFRAGSSSTTIGGTPFTEGQIMAIVVSLAGLIFALRPYKVSEHSPTATEVTE
jgi:prolipoprotein diacylglyceryltransferase